MQIVFKQMHFTHPQAIQDVDEFVSLLKQQIITSQ